ncbi:ribonuclease G [Jeongeupia naejangsanensis]|uniref:Ribonuclease G n=1 Tax=Jeongeupia naejangsanensis TaxID=613195 RepID=A0ABS2BRF8_9NEIS|nr:ribonuclease G [Jeongeupia naejangsanensis]MBM3117379.1 ribonuclease G [Jeongeupia naejangsanensis]
MKEEILVNVTPQETRVATIEDGIVQDIHIERSAHLGLVGNIYLGMVKRVLPGMQSAFVEIGLERAAFLHIADVIEQRQSPNETFRIEKLVHEGQPLMVQVIKDPIGTKGARLSTQISIAGRFLVFLPQEHHIGISQRIENGDEREQLRERLNKLLPKEHHGYIIRTSADHATDDELKADIDYLDLIWADILQKSQKLPAKSLLFQDLSLQLRALRDMVNADTEAVLVDSRENYLKMAEFAGRFVADVAPRVQHYSGERPLFELYGIEAEIERALSRRVNLKFGGYLIIDQTEAMTTIDVNTGGFVGTRNFDDTIFKTNLEATHVIARQLRLRNLGGIIIVDFIDMDNEEHQTAVLDELKKALARDRTKITVSTFTSLGLIEITRKRTRESLAHVLCEPCPTCQGRGEIKTAESVCYEILREILREERQFSAREYRILASQTVIDRFLDEESTNLAMLADFIKKPIYLQVETAYSQEQFDVVLV